ncbi:MAG: sulfatase-like hydrolase/transferase [Candidatus Aminicenantes bacterium]|nr:sulfatase-like hydrolase/transferase [Candidatus Aminicenantes bacterium]
MKKLFRAIGLLHLASFIFLMVFLSTILQDRLLFKTDWLTLGYFLLSLNWLLVLIALPPFCLAARVLEKRRPNLKILYARAITFMIAYTILMNLFNNPFVFQTQSLLQLAIVNLLCLALAYVAARKFCDLTIFGRIEPIGRWFLLAALLFIVSAKAYFILQSHEPRTGKPKNVILVVLDSLSAASIREYDPGAALSVEDISADYALFENVRTNFTYTYGYFDALFGGRKSGRSGAANLLSLLQQNGVNTRWLASQGNAVPDNHAVKNYRGLRSYFFNYRFSWLPALLGIDYNIYRAPFKKDGTMIYAAHGLIDLFSSRRVDFAAEVHREIKRLRSDPRPFFFLIHEFPACETSKPEKLWETGKIRNQRDRISEGITKNDFRYDDGEEWLVREWEAKALAASRAGFACLKNIHDFLKTKGWDRDTLVILTADHGKIFRDHKVWYGFHNNEEVARVPLLVFNATLPKRSSGLGETIDITQTVLENFRVKQKLDRGALSLFSGGQKNAVTTLTEYSSVRREQFLNLYKDQAGAILKFVVDPGKKDFCCAYIVRGFQETLLGKFALAGSPLQAEFESVFSAYRLSREPAAPR